MNLSSINTIKGCKTKIVIFLLLLEEHKKTIIFWYKREINTLQLLYFKYYVRRNVSNKIW